MRDSWQKSRLGELCEIYQPQTISTKEMDESAEFPVFGANGIIGRYHKFNHEEPQLLITCRGATCGAVNISSPKSWITGNAMVVRPKDSSLDLRFLEYFFRGGIDISKVITGSAQPQITRTNLAPIAIEYPPIEEQRRIVAILDEAFAAIDKAKTNTEKNIQNARELFDSYTDLELSQERPGSGLEKLDDVCDLITCGVAARPEYVTHGIPFLSAKNVKNGQVIWDEYKFVSERTHKQLTKINKPNIGDVLYTRVGSYGEAAVVEDEREFSVFVSLTLIKPRKGRLNNYYLKYFLNSTRVKKLARSSISSSGVGNLNVGAVRRFAIILPPISDQQEIVTNLDSVSFDTQRLEFIYKSKVVELDELKKSILQKGFNGQLAQEHTL